MRFRTAAIAVVIVAVVLGAVYLLVGERELPFGSEEATPTPVSTEPAVAASRRVLAEARVVPVAQAALGTHSGGRVRRLLVEEGDFVSREQVLVQLDSARQAAAVLQAEANLAAAQAELDRLESGATAERIVAASAALEAAKAAAQSADGAVTVAGANLAKLRSGATFEEIAIAERRVKELENLQWGAQGQRDSICGQVGKYGVTQADCDSAEAAVGQAYEAVQIAMLDLQRVRSGTRSEDQRAGQAAVTQAEGQRRAANARIAEAEAALAQLLAGASAEELAIARARVDQAQAAVELARIDMDDTQIRAPFSGTVAGLSINEGELALPGAPLVVVADLSTYRIETEDLTELNIVGISAGDVATITFDAIPGLELLGEVEFVRPIGTDRLGDIVYTAVVIPSEQDSRLRWNMTAVVDIAPE